MTFQTNYCLFLFDFPKILSLVHSTAWIEMDVAESLGDSLTTFLINHSQ